MPSFGTPRISTVVFFPGCRRCVGLETTPSATTFLPGGTPNAKRKTHHEEDSPFSEFSSERPLKLSLFPPNGQFTPFSSPLVRRFCESSVCPVSPDSPLKTPLVPRYFNSEHAHIPSSFCLKSYSFTSLPTFFYNPALRLCVDSLDYPVF